jgi:hypothetical protein
MKQLYNRTLKYLVLLSYFTSLCLVERLLIPNVLWQIAKDFLRIEHIIETKLLATYAVLSNVNRVNIM